MPQPDLAVVDVETTGFVPEKHDRIVEIGIVRTDFQGSYLIAHTAPFDVRFLKAELKRAGGRLE